MTIQEAIDIINDVSWEHNGRHYGKISPARELAISALKKQIPKKPMGIYDENEHHSKDDDDLYEPALFGVCPVCNQEVQDGMIYCSFCGQALDWGDTE